MTLRRGRGFWGIVGDAAEGAGPLRELLDDATQGAGRPLPARPGTLSDPEAEVHPSLLLTPPAVIGSQRRPRGAAGSGFNLIVPRGA
ncbi:hypothetical protein NDU88_007454 [Pleurodeles waltl]|uniref:Uncharacterized protein n=1 Tax=Pleurodeles waltl TaxID=8319 RepID=A0AAV7WDJ1_PLEWA|nr:hypothetical protein NDU88_007454 [Pleurodeles waltl]